MAEAMRFESVSKETIKPSSPTPQNLRTHKLSFIDQLLPATHTPILFFYPNTDNHEEGLILHDLKAHDKCLRLKTSLSHTLTHFYPLAGRVRDNAVIECNDEGVEFWEARVHGVLSNILKQPDADSVYLQKFMPTDDRNSDGALVKVQANVFECGGMAIGVSVSHKIADACTIGSFITAWSSMAVGCMTEEMLPKYVLGSLYPSMDTLVGQRSLEFKQSDCITRRYVFDSSKIQKLKTRARSNMVDQPTRVEAVLVLIWKCATTASQTNLGITTRRPSMVSQVVNIRKRVSPPLAETCVGNFVGNFITHTKEDENNYYMELQELVVQLRKGLEEFCKVYVEKIQRGNAFDAIYEKLKDLELAIKEGLSFYYGCSSWCHLGFYDADFGWGKPKWVSIPSLKVNNTIILMDTSDGKGIEAWVTLSEEDMAVMETNDELLEFAALNPSIT